MSGVAVLYRIDCIVVMLKKNLRTLIRENKTLVIIIAVILVLIELEIFALAAMKSGHKSWLQVLDAKGSVIHETDGKNLSEFNKYYFEKTFGPLEQFQFRLITKEIPFPFRSWFSAAVGIPVGVILIFAFAVRSFQSLFYSEDYKHEAIDMAKGEYEYRFEKIIAVLSRFNIFTLGFLVCLVVFSYWAIPNMLVYAGRIGVETLTRYKWIFLAVSIVLLGLIIWIIYLKYLLAKRSIDSQTEIAKHSLQLEFDQDRQIPLQLEYNGQEPSANSLEHGDKNSVVDHTSK